MDWDACGLRLADAITAVARTCHFIRCLRGCSPQHPQDKAYILYHTLMTGVLERATCVWHEGQRPSKGSIVLHWKCVASMSATVDHVHHWHWPRTTWHSPNGSRLTCLSACETFGLFTPSAEKIVQTYSVWRYIYTLYQFIYSNYRVTDCTVLAVLVMHFCDVCLCLCDYLQGHKVLVLGILYVFLLARCTSICSTLAECSFRAVLIG